MAEQKIKAWTPISCVLAMQHLVQKDGCPDFLFARVLWHSLLSVNASIKRSRRRSIGWTTDSRVL